MCHSTIEPFSIFKFSGSNLLSGLINIWYVRGSKAGASLTGPAATAGFGIAPTDGALLTATSDDE